jgi:hypothetical protein
MLYENCLESVLHVGLTGICVNTHKAYGGGGKCENTVDVACD